MAEPRGATDRRRSSAAEGSHLRSIVERLADGVLIIDRAGGIRFANPAAEQLFGRSATELVGSDLGFPVIPGDTTEIEVVRAGGGGATTSVEIRVVETDWEGDRALLVSLRDVTDRKRAEERARQLDRERAARADAEAASQAKSDFLAMMSHELRTPLNAVIGYTELLDLGIGGGTLTSEQRHQLARIRASGRHLLGLVDEVLDLAKIEAGRLTVEPGVARAGETADAAIALVQPRAEEKGISLVSRCLTSGAVLYEGDEDRVRQILVNLLANAVKFTEPGGHITVECGSSETSDGVSQLDGRERWVFLRVRDTGIGIPLDQHARIFDPFVQGEMGHTRANDGSGLGLTISRRLARLMDGDLTVRSDVGQGAEFTLWLPAALEGAANTPWTAMSGDNARIRGLADVGELLLREVGAVLDAFVRRLRSEELVPAARTLRYSQLADHIASHLADLGGMLIAIEEAGGQPLSLMADTAEIQRVVAERHGAQRARLGWTETALRHEFALLREELERMIRRHSTSVPADARDEGVTLLTRFLEQAEECSVRALHRSLSSREPDSARRVEHDGQAHSAMHEDSEF